MASTLDEEIKRERAKSALLSIDDSDYPVDQSDSDAAAAAQAEEETNRQLAEATAASKSDKPDVVSKSVDDTYGDWRKWPSMSPEESKTLFETKSAQSVGAPSPEPDIKPQPTVFDTETKQAVGAPSPEPIVSPPTPIETPPPSMAPGLGTVGGAPETKALEPVTAESVQAAPEERPASRPGAAVPSPLPSPPDIPAGHIDLEPIVRRAELVKLPGERVYPTVAEDQGAPGKAVAVRRAEPVVTLPTGPKEPGAHTALAPPGQMDLREDTDVPTARAVPVAQSAAPTQPSQPAAKPIYDDPSTWLTPDGTPVGGTVTQTDTTLPPPMNAPNGKTPVALIIHHTSGRNSAESVVNDWRTNRPGVGAQMIMDRDGTIHETNKEFGYNGTGNFLHSVIPGVFNQTAVGIEVIAKDDADMTPAQLESLKRLAGPGGPYANTPVYGHSQVSPGDRDNEGVRGVAAINEARKTGGGDSGDTLRQLGSAGLNVTHFGYKGDSDLDSDSAAGRGKFVENMMPGYDVALNAAAAKLVGNPIPGSEFQYAGRTWRYGDQVPEKYKDARFDIFDKDNTAFSGGQLGQPAEGPKKPAWESWATLPPEQEAAANKQGQQEAVGALDKLNQTTERPGDFWKILDKPIQGVPDSVRQQYQQNFKTELTKYAQNFYGEQDPEKAFQRAIADPSIGANLSNAVRSFGGTIGQADIGIAQMGQSIDYNRLDSFAKLVNPNATGDKRSEFIKALTDIKDTRERHDHFNAVYASLDQNTRDAIGDPASLLDSIDHIASPEYQAKQSAAIKLKKDWVDQQLTLDPSIKGTAGAWWSSGTGQNVANIALMAMPGLARTSAMAAQIYSANEDRIRKEHPDWTDQQVSQQSSISAFAQLAPQEALIAATHGILGPIISWAKNPVVRFGIGGGTHLALGAASGALGQVGENIAENKSPLQDTGQAALAGALAATPFAVHGGIHGVMSPPEAKPEIAPPAPEAVPPPIGTRVRAADILGPDVPDTSMPWHKPSPIVTRGTERTTFTPAELAEGTGRLAGRTPEELQAAAEQMKPPMDFNRLNVFLDSSEAQQSEINKAQAAQASQPPLTLAEAIQQQRAAAAAAAIGGTPRVVGVDERGNVRTVQQGRSSARVTVREMLNAGGDSAVAAKKALDAGHGLDDPMPKPGEPAPQVARPGSTLDPATQALRAKQPHIYAKDPNGNENVAMIIGDTAGGYKIMMPRQGMHDPNKAYSTSAEAQTAARNAFEKAGWKISFDPRNPAESMSPKITLPPTPRVSEAEPAVSAIANRYTAERMVRGELGQVDPSQGKSTEEMVLQGFKMSPEQREGLIDNFTKGKGGDLDQQGAAIRSKESILSVQSGDASRAAAADPTNPQLAAQAKAALDAVTAFHNGPIKKFKKVWSDAGRGLQREIPLDYTTLNGVKEAYLKGNGKEVPAELEPKLKQIAGAVSKAANAERAAMNNLGKEIEARTRGNPLSDEHVRARLMEIMKDLPCRT